MSAFVVGRAHIKYIVDAALSRRLAPHGPIRWYCNGETGQIDDNTAQEVGQALWDENIRSVKARYPDVKFNADLPGRIGEDYVFRYPGRGPGESPDPVQVIKACHCLNYQSCEADDWETTRAYTILQAIIGAAIRNLDGYEDAAWEIGT